MFYKLLIIGSVVVAVNSLRCVFGGQGTVNGQTGASTDTNVTCRSSTKFCVKLESDTTLNGGGFQ
ncbi:unnamed protein product [Gongylonema pulchrum]|uniref:Secreted protein n=1 Tax=Gongylonema pulchrum TaxID=637853 RepID=A0A183DHR5_9BILA|nr:unnamed protein product [Gongylonema pulchrum]